MTVLRMDNVSMVVEDLAAAVDFFVELGLKVEGKTSVQGAWVDKVLALQGVEADIVMLRTPDGHGGIELSSFRKPKAVRTEPKGPPVNALGLRRVMFAVTGIDQVVARLKKHGAELIGGLEQYEDSYRLCYLRGPEGIMVALAEELA